MAVVFANIIAAKFAENLQVTQYTVLNGKTIIDKFTATNVGSYPQSISVNLVIGGGSAASNNLIVNARIVSPGETYTMPELIGHVLEQSSFISTIASAVSTITIRASGREIT